MKLSIHTNRSSSEHELGFQVLPPSGLQLTSLVFP